MDSLNLPYTICEILVALGAVIGNSLVIVAFGREKRLRRRTNYYIVSLAVADLLVGLVGIPCALLASVGLPRHLYACLFTISLLVVLCTISIFCLVAVSIDRYWAILFPMGYARNVTTNIAIWIILVCWVLGGVVGFLPLMGWHAPPTTPQLCLFTKVMDYNYLVFLYFATIVFPALLLAAFYAHIYTVVLNQFKQMLIINGTTENNSMLRVLGAARKREVKATQNLSIIVLFFIICWMPLYTINFIEAYCTTCNVPLPLLNSCIILSHLNSALNPLLYAYHLKDFRLALKYVVCGKKMNSLKRLDSNNTSNYDQHNKLSVYDAKKYSTRSCQNHRIQQISHHGNRYNSCYYPARMDQRCTKYTRMQLESINMQTFNEHKITTNIDEKKWAKEEKKMSKEERKMSKEDQKLERKLSSPYKYQKFNEEGDKGRNSGEEFIQSEDFSDPNIIVIEGRKRSATFDKNKINIEQMESEMGIQDDKFESMDDITDSNQTENSKITETIESTDTGDGKRKTSLDDEIDDNINRSNGANTSNNSNNGTPEESIKTKRLSIETGNNRTDTQEINIELINKKSITENRTDKELSILDTITDELVKTENHYDQIQRKIETQNDVHMGIEIVDEGLNSETTIESNKINGTVQTKKVIIDENATIKQPNDKHTNGMPLNDDYQNSILTLEEFQTQPNFNNKESIYGSMTGSPTAYYTGNTENNREVNHQNNNSTTEGINKLHRKESGHSRNIQSNNVNSKHTVENSIKYTENDAITHHIELATNNSAKEANKPNTNDVLSQPNDRCDELSNDLKNHVEFNDNNSYSNLNNAYCNDAYEEEKDIELESNARNQNNNPIFVTDVKLQTQNNMECLIPTDNEHYSVKEITNEIEISRSNRNISQYNTGNNEDLKDNQNSIKPRSQSLRMEDSSRKTSSMFNSFKWRSKSKDRESKPSETVRNVDELRFQFEIFDINIIRTGNEDGSGNPSKKI